MSGKLKDSHLFCSYTVSGNSSFFPVVSVCLFICDPFGKNVSKVTEITIQIMAKRQQNFKYLKPLLY